MIYRYRYTELEDLKFFEQWTSGFCTHFAKISVKYCKCKAQHRIHQDVSYIFLLSLLLDHLGVFQPLDHCSVVSCVCCWPLPVHEGLHVSQSTPGIFLHIALHLFEENKTDPGSVQSVHTLWQGFRGVASLRHTAQLLHICIGAICKFDCREIAQLPSISRHCALQTKPCHRSTCFLQQQTCQSWQLYQGCCLQRFS